jgi:hypothetical protein
LNLCKFNPLCKLILPALLLIIPLVSCLKPTEFDESQIPLNPPASGPNSQDPDPDPVSIPGLAPLNGNTTPGSISSPDFLGDISWNPLPGSDGKFEPFKDYTATIELAAKPGHSLPASVTVEGALSADYDAEDGTITAVFPRTHYPVSAVSDLTTAIAALSPLPAPGSPKNKNIIELTEAFYDDANNSSGTNSGGFIAIGVSTDDNTIPYTIRGLGKTSGKKLGAGILLANNNVTLENLRIDITSKEKGVPHEWGVSGLLYYRAAVIIGRYKAPPDTGTSSSDYYADSPSKNVSVQNCNISLAVPDSMIAGIYIRPGTSAGPIENISIADNEISVEATNDSGSAAQALLVQRYVPTLSITGNGLESKNKLRTPNTPTWPAGGLYMQIGHDIPANVTPLISGNTINGYPTYDFYINILSKGDRVGVEEMIDNKFATPDSVWMTADSTDTGDNRSFYKKLIETLLPQTRSGSGYGFLAMWFGGTSEAPANNDSVFEAYHRKNAKLYAIDFWGYTINNGAYDESNNAANERRARLLLNQETGRVREKTTFCWTPEAAGTNINVSVP